MKKMFTITALIFCISCFFAVPHSLSAEQPFISKSSGIDFEIVPLDRTDGFNEGIMITRTDGVQVIIGFRESLSRGNALLFSIDGEETIVTFSKNGVPVFSGKAAGDPRAFICIFQAILDAVQAFDACLKDDTVCILDNMLAFVSQILSCTATTSG